MVKWTGPACMMWGFWNCLSPKFLFHPIHTWNFPYWSVTSIPWSTNTPRESSVYSTWMIFDLSGPFQYDILLRVVLGSGERWARPLSMESWHETGPCSTREVWRCLHLILTTTLAIVNPLLHIQNSEGLRSLPRIILPLLAKPAIISVLP